jgi:hypothetical protein
VIGSARPSSPAPARIYSCAVQVLARRHRRDREVKQLRDGSGLGISASIVIRRSARAVRACWRQRP